MDELLELVAVLRALSLIRDVLRGKQPDFGGAAIALGRQMPNDRHAAGCCCPNCDERLILGEEDAETGL